MERQRERKERLGKEKERRKGEREKKEREMGGGGRETVGLNTLIFNPDKMSV